MNFTLTKEEAASLIGVLGQLPTNSGVFPVLVKLVEQYRAQDTDQPVA